MHCHALYIRIAPARIGLLRFLLEGYDGLAVLSTCDKMTGCVRLLVPRPRYAELMHFLSAVAPELHSVS
jgi:hypothetical protein